MQSSRDRAEPLAFLAVAAVALGAVLACAAMPLVYRHVPSDLTRVGVIARAMREEHPRVVVFGDSRAQAGVDARLLGETAMNFATGDQSLVETLVMAEHLPSSVERVVVFVSPEDLGGDWIVFPEAENALWMNGLRASPALRNAYEHCFGVTIHANGELRERFTARWTLRQALESSLRMRIRPSLDLARERNDLYFPSTYAARLSDAQFALDIEQTRSKVARELRADKACALATLEALTRRSGRRLLLVIPPIHPDALPRGYDPWRRGVADYARRQRIALSDQTHAMPVEAFADARHLSHAGARAFTTMLRTLVD